MSDVEKLVEMRDILEPVWMDCCDSGNVRDDIDKVINMLKEWIGELDK